MTCHIGNCLDVLPTLEAGSIDACVTDPPYHLTTGKNGGSGPASVNLDSPYGRARVGTGFMGMTWDGGDIANTPEVWEQCLRVAKPGAFLLAFGGTRTFHRMACAIEDAGWELRDCIMWVYGSGFPKSLDVSKAIDKEAGAERLVVGTKLGQPGYSLTDGEAGGVAMEGNVDGSLRNGAAECSITAPSTDAAKQWQGWGTALKPAWEPIIVARKSLIGTVAENVLKHGTGAMNIDGCRIETDSTDPNHRNPLSNRSGEKSIFGIGGTGHLGTGRWPANVIHDGSEEVLAGFPDTHAPGSNGRRKNGSMFDVGEELQHASYTDAGSVARFFYCAKTSRADRNEGCESFDAKPLNWSSGDQSPGTFQSEGTDKTSPNNHPTVKPTALMRYLVRLVTAPGGTVLDPFMGSGSTGKACTYEGFNFIGIEREADYARIAEARIAFAVQDQCARTAQSRMFA